MPESAYITIRLYTTQRFNIMPPKDTKTFKPISDKLTLKQRLDRPDATLHALCDPNPSATGDDTKSSESIIERFVIRLPGTTTEVLLKVPSKRLILPGNFKLSDQQANFDGMDAVGYVRSSEPSESLSKSLAKENFSPRYPAVVCPVIDMKDPRVQELIRAGDIEALIAYCDSYDYLMRPETEFVVVDGANRWKICARAEMEMYIKPLSVRTSIFERMLVATLVNDMYHANTETTWIDNIWTVVQAQQQGMNQEQIYQCVAGAVKSRSAISMATQLYRRTRHFWGALTLEVKQHGSSRVTNNTFHEQWYGLSLPTILDALSRALIPCQCICVTLPALRIVYITTHATSSTRRPHCVL